MELSIRCKGEGGETYNRQTITSNEDHVSALISDGTIQEDDRYRELARLYRGQLDAANRHIKDLLEMLRK